jgi:hypothetical protein
VRNNKSNRHFATYHVIKEIAYICIYTSDEIMKRVISILLIFFSYGLVSAQSLIFNSALISVTPGATIYIIGPIGGFTNTGNGTIDLAGTIDLEGSWTNDGVTQAFIYAPLTDGTVRFSGPNFQLIDGTNSTTFENLTINKTGGNVTFNVNNTAVAGNFFNQASTFITNNFNMSCAGNWTNTGTFTAGSGNVTLNGNNTQSVASGVSPFYNITFNNTSVGANNLNVTEPMTINGNSTFTDGIVYYSGTGSLTYNNGATSNQGATGSFVNGLITKNGTNAFIFPTGDVVLPDVVWAPIEITAPAANSTITSEYFFTSSPNNWNLVDMCNPALLDHTSGVEYWQLNRTFGAGAYPDVTLYWKDAVRSGITNLPDLVVAHYEPCPVTNKWVSLGGVAVNDGGGTGHIQNALAFTSYSPVTFGTKLNTNTLPVELISFKAKCDEGKVDIYWETATETNNDFFTLERSADAENWNFVANINGAGNSNTTIIYKYTDQFSLPGKSYYRLKQNDYNGDQKSGMLADVNCNDESSQEFLVIYPNPASNEVNILINSVSSGACELIITDVIGQKVFVQELNLITGLNNFSVNVNHFSDATYYVNLVSSEHYFPVHKLLINK